MWTVLALVLLAPVGWALLGAEPIRAWEPWAEQNLPGWLTAPVVVSTQAVVVALMVGVLLGLGRARVATTHLSTLAHEVGHGLTAALFGARIDRIILARDGSGMAHFSFPFGRPVLLFAVSFAGYVTPGVFGVASMQVALAGRGTVWLVYMMVLLVTMLVLVVGSAAGCGAGPGGGCSPSAPAGWRPWSWPLWLGPCWAEASSMPWGNGGWRNGGWRNGGWGNGGWHNGWHNW